MAPSPIHQNNLKCNYWPIPIGLYTHPSYLALLTYKLSPEELCTVIRHFYQTSLIIQKCGSMEVVCMYRKRECVCYEIIFELSLSYNKFSLSRLTSFAIAFAFALRSSGISRRVGTCAREFSFWSLFLVWLILVINFHSVICDKCGRVTYCLYNCTSVRLMIVLTVSYGIMMSSCDTRVPNSQHDRICGQAPP